MLPAGDVRAAQRDRLRLRIRSAVCVAWWIVTAAPVLEVLRRLTLAARVPSLFLPTVRIAATASIVVELSNWEGRHCLLDMEHH
jgi:hypothetical protein